MAIYHLNAKAIGRSQGRSATGAAAYRAAMRIEDTRTGLVFDFSRKRGVDGAEILAPDGAVLDRATLWNLVEHTEKRTDAQVCREIEVALPRELTPEQMRGLVRGFVREQFVALGMVADLAFHHLTGQNPHCHILLTLREWRGGAFGLKRREWNDRALCEQWRQAWASHANAALAAAGQEARMDHRTLAEQAADASLAGFDEIAAALDREPTRHERGNPAAIAHNAQVREANSARLAAAARQQAEINRVTPAIDAIQPANADAAFMADMAQRTGVQASRWRFYNERLQTAEERIEQHKQTEARLSRERERCALARRAARQRLHDWRETQPKPPWWRFWERPAWRRADARVQDEARAAKARAVRAEQAFSQAAVTKRRQDLAEHQAEREHALRERRRLAFLPSEAVEQAHEQARRADALRRLQPAQRLGHTTEVHPPARPRPGRR